MLQGVEAASKQAAVGRRWVTPRGLGTLLTLTLLVLSGCAPVTPSAPQPTAAATATAATSAAPASGAPAAASSASSWDQVVAAANQEGTLDLVGQAGTGVQDALTASFQQAYPAIHVEFTSGNGNDTVTSILTARAAGQLTTDLMVQGPPNLMELLDANALQSIPALLSGPEEDPTAWSGGAFHYADNAGQYILSMIAGTGTVGIYNPTLVSASDFTSYKGFLDPKWNGKLAMLDPRLPGSAQAEAQFLYASPDLGKDFLQQLFAQDIALDQDDLTVTNWVAQGKYPVALGVNGYNAVQLRSQGVPLEFISSNSMAEGGWLTSSWGGVAVLQGAPHPNAVKVYLNWLLSKEGQQALVKASGYPSRRQDVSTQGVLDATIPSAKTQYMEINQENYVKQRPEIVSFLTSLINS